MLIDPEMLHPRRHLWAAAWLEPAFEFRKKIPRVLSTVGRSH
jgi:hypothetical protein